MREWMTSTGERISSAAMIRPPGHIPGFHLPGTLIPMGAIAGQEAAEADAEMRRRAEQAREREYAALILRVAGTRR